MIRKASSKPIHRRLLTYDLEWHPDTYEFRLAGLYDGETYQSFTRLDDFVNACISHKFRGAWFAAHGGGSYDIQFIIDAIHRKPNTLTIDCAFSGSSANNVTISDLDNHEWHFIDTALLLRAKLEKIGEWIGYAKGGESDENRLSIFKGSIGELRDYNERDCILLFKALERLEENLLSKGGRLQRTLASCGLYLFRSRFLTKEIATCASDNNWIRRGYISSRVEVIQKAYPIGGYVEEGNLPSLKVYDFNSSFPWSMTLPQPGELERVDTKIPKTGIFFADCDINIPDCYYPPIPLKRESRVFFPTGRFRQTISRDDLEAIEISGGRIERVYEVHHYKPFYDLKAFAEMWYEEKRKADEGSFEKAVAKLAINSVYGKFAEREEKEKLAFGAEHPDEGRDWEQVGNGIWRGFSDHEAEHIHVPISANVVSSSRLLLLKAMHLAGNACYVDTDSVITPSTLDTSDSLGSLKLEGTFSQGRFLAPKLYALDDKVKAKGFRKLTFNEFVRLAEGKSVEYERVLRVKELANSGDMKPRKRIQAKRIYNNFPKRCFIGNDSRPWRVEELPE